LVAGNIDLNCDLASNSLAQYRNGNIKVFAVMADTRWAPAPEVATTDEERIPGIHISTWLGLGAPKNTPADIVAKVNAAALAAMADPDAHKRIADLGMQGPPPEGLTPAGLPGCRARAQPRQGGRSASAARACGCPLLWECGRPFSLPSTEPRSRSGIRSSR